MTMLNIGLKVFRCTMTIYLILLCAITKLSLHEITLSTLFNSFVIDILPFIVNPRIVTFREKHFKGEAIHLIEN